MTYKHDACTILFGLTSDLLRANQTREFCYSFHYNTNSSDNQVILMVLLLRPAAATQEVLAEKSGGGVRLASQNLYRSYDQILRFPLPHS